MWRLDPVSIQRAVPPRSNDSAADLALGVELCHCPERYSGESCQVNFLKTITLSCLFSFIIIINLLVCTKIGVEIIFSCHSTVSVLMSLHSFYSHVTPQLLFSCHSTFTILMSLHSFYSLQMSSALQKSTPTQNFLTFLCNVLASWACCLYIVY